jgi:chorismate mutase
MMHRTFVVNGKSIESKELKMSDKTNYYVLKEKAVPEVLLKVVEAKRLFDSGKVASVQDATDAVGISRSSFYKYKDDIFPFHDNQKGKTITLVIQLDDEPGLLSNILRAIDKFKCNILTIHQSVPVNNIATVTISIKIVPGCESASVLFEAIESMKGICNIKILARE